MTENGWYAMEHVSGLWKPTLRLTMNPKLAPIGYQLRGAWFNSKDECEQFIRNEIIGKGLLKQTVT